MRSHEIDYRIVGGDLQFVEVELDPGETVIAEAGAMMYMEDSVSFETRMGDGSEANQSILGKLLSAGGRLLTGESLFLTHFTHRGLGKGHVAFAAPYPGTILPIDLPNHGGSILAQKDAFLCAAYGTKVGVALNRKLGAGFFGGEGFILQRFDGDGKVFVHAGGTVVERQLNNETLRVDTGCIVAFEPSIDFSIESAGGLRSMIFGGEGIFLATLRGTGKVWLQSMPVSKLIKALAPAGKNQGKGDSSILDNLFER
ncbi:MULTISPECIES: TIGR00266 family protein [Prolixibacter]|uniref:TIGR00266 family protein n=1 Tax=Prolixibacter denitrificans TaxID=1541063 RepID=A0A2P8CH71_9BACT|nr:MULTISPECIES: TIGR00266 family protein [Prolixibacter]PSK84330.1 uncharacterized protein (TIGR00266 family) [Prolixibacter denitrificans]GET20506.1 TIGR00266 family protein [Prolixibacter denitrificans]GET27171.1 TIGR00266 family protein [Prolixibacter sp. NT017]